MLLSICFYQERSIGTLSLSYAFNNDPDVDMRLFPSLQPPTIVVHTVGFGPIAGQRCHIAHIQPAVSNPFVNFFVYLLLEQLVLYFNLVFFKSNAAPMLSSTIICGANGPFIPFHPLTRNYRHISHTI